MSLLSRFVESEPDEPRVLDVGETEAGEAFEVLSSETARRVLAAVYEEPSTPPEVREQVGTTLQNVHYHLDRLESAGLIEEAGVGYSENGNEMTVYAPKSEALVLFAGRDRQRARLRTVLGRVLGLSLLLGAAAAVLEAFIRGRGDVTEFARTGDGAAGGAGAVETAAGTAAGIDPVVAFVLGGSVVIAALGLWWYWRGATAGV